MHLPLVGQLWLLGPLGYLKTTVPSQCPSVNHIWINAAVWGNTCRCQWVVADFSCGALLSFPHMARNKTCANFQDGKANAFILAQHQHPGGREALCRGIWVGRELWLIPVSPWLYSWKTKSQSECESFDRYIGLPGLCLERGGIQGTRALALLW